MLVLSRKVGERVKIIVPPSDKEQVIDVELLRKDSSHRGKASLGFQCDNEVRILRKEIWLREQHTTDKTAE